MMLTYVATSRESSHEYRVETTGASQRASWNPGFADNPAAFRSWRDVKRHCGERRAGNGAERDKVAGRSVSRGDVASHARSVEGPHFPNVKFPFDSPVYERRVISLRHARNSTEIYRIATKD